MAVCHLDGVQRFGQCPDLVYLDKNGVCTTQFNPFAQEVDVCYKQIVTYQLALPSDFIGQKFPSVPVVFVHPVFDGVDRVVGDKFLQVFSLLGRSTFFTVGAFKFGVIVNAVFIEFRSGTVESNLYIFTRLVACIFNSGKNGFQCFFGSSGQVRGKAAFISYSSAEPFVVKHFFECMKNLGTHTKPFAERVRSNRTNHEFLESDGGVRVRTAVNDVHHRNGQHVSICSADVAIQG